MIMAEDKLGGKIHILICTKTLLLIPNIRNINIRFYKYSLNKFLFNFPHCLTNSTSLQSIPISTKQTIMPKQISWFVSPANWLFCFWSVNWFCFLWTSATTSTICKVFVNALCLLFFSYRFVGVLSITGWALSSSSSASCWPLIMPNDKQIELISLNSFDAIVDTQLGLQLQL